MNSGAAAGGTRLMNQAWYSRMRAWLIGIGSLATALVITATSLFTVACSSPAGGQSKIHQSKIYFHTLPPGERLLSGAECAREIRAFKSTESRPANARFNHTVGQHVQPWFFPAGDSLQVAELTPLISGEFTGTTQQILQWTACKWGIDQDVVFAQAAVESWWRQDELGDWTSDARLCPPGYGIGAAGKPDACAQSYGILQNRYSTEKSAWPGIGDSTAMNADAAYAIWRSCYDGYEIWLNNAPKGQPYHAGDLWGCVGRWFTGSWYTPEADRYIHLVKKYLSEQVWLQPYFAQIS